METAVYLTAVVLSQGRSEYEMTFSAFAKHAMSRSGIRPARPPHWPARGCLTDDFTGNPAYSIRAYSYRGCLVTFWAQSVSAGSVSVGVM
jgi:hypothetical protein